MYSNIIGRKSDLYALVLKVIAAISSIGFSLYVTRNLTIDEAGRFFLLFALITILSDISRMGMDAILVRESAISGSENNVGDNVNIFIAALIIVVIFFGFITVVTYLISQLVPMVLEKNVENLTGGLIVIGVALFYSVTQINGKLINGLRWSALSIFFSSTAFFIASLMTFFYINANNLAAILRSIFVASIFVASISSYSYGRLAIRKVQQFRPTFTAKPIIKRLRYLLRESFPLWIVTIFTQMQLWVGAILLSYYGDDRDIALFSVAVRVALAIGFFLTIINVIVAPKFATLAANGDFYNLSKLFNGALVASCALSFPIISIVIFFSSYILGLFGEAYIDGQLLLYILSFGVFISSVCGSNGNLLVALGSQKFLSIIICISGSVSLAISYILILKVGVVGAAIGAASGLIVQNLIGLFLCKRIINKSLGL